MNINIKINIPLTTGKVLTTDADLMLTPFYVSESELLSKYLDKYNNEQFLAARKMIFSSSLTAERIIRGRLDGVLTEKDVALFKRDLVLCLASEEFGSKYSSDFIKSMTRSKTLASFQVTTTITKDSNSLYRIMDDARECIEEAKKFLDCVEKDKAGLISGFIKSELNCNKREVHRLWHHYLLPDLSYEGHASTKVRYRGRMYKNGGSY